MITYYDVLEVGEKARVRDIRIAYRAKMRVWHPDVSKHRDAKDVATVLNAAYEVLSDPIKRSRYDRALAIERAKIAARLYDPHGEMLAGWLRVQHG